MRYHAHLRCFLQNECRDLRDCHLPFPVISWNQRAYFLVALSQERTRYHGLCVSYKLLIRYYTGLQTPHFSLAALTVVFLVLLDTLYQDKNSRPAQALPVGLTPSPISAELYWADGTIPAWRCQGMTATCQGQLCHKAN